MRYFEKFSSTIENGFVHIPTQGEWLPEYLHELSVFPNGKYDDQVDSTSQAFDWVKNGIPCYGLLEYYCQEAEMIRMEESAPSKAFVVTRGDMLREWDRTRLFGRF
jgi:hypothetical protein